MFASRLFLTLVGLAYGGLALWCVARPQQTSASVGFRLTPGSGESEYLVVYGGLQVGLGLWFLLPWLRPHETFSTLLACLTIHASLVAFRSLGFLWYSGFGATTYAIAAVEWLILLGAVGLWWTQGDAAP